MRKSLALSAVFLCAAALLGLGLRAAYTEAGPTTGAAGAGRLVVHEWGTFTSFSGSDGVRIEFRPLADNDLPDFVINRAKQVGAQEFMGKGMWLVQERMETPVTYFYTDRERDVRVKVGFPQGLLTEFYPPVEKMLPEFAGKNKVVKLRDSELDWGTVHLIPQDKLRTEVADPAVAEEVRKRLLDALIPPAFGDHYGFARETDSALVQVQLPPNKKHPSAPQGHFFEKFLFYRGIGNFELPISVQALGNGRFEVRNNGPEPIRSLFLVTAVDDAKVSELRFAVVKQIDARGRLVIEQSTSVASMEDLSEAVVKSLVAENLYEKEARAMVNTWRNSWFGEEGTRLFYMVPTKLTDELLPLTVSPAPDELVRVLVGRYEIMSPEDENRVTKLVEKSIQSRAEYYKKAEKDEKLRNKGYQLPKEIKGLGRLAEPALARVKTISKDAGVKAEAANLLSMWMAQKHREDLEPVE
jgi:hypothetical protein